MLQSALRYAAQGWAVFPIIHRAKEPAVRSGFYAATTNPATIQRWFGGGHPYNLGVRTGLASRVWVLDVDGPDGADNLRRLVAEHGALPDSRQSQTSRGRHLWFQAETEIPCSSARISPGLDVRADGGYVLAPPSVHPDGTVYRWLTTGPLAPAPDWLIRLAHKPPPAITPPTTVHREFKCNGDAYSTRALERELGDLSNAARGYRNHALNRASFSLHPAVSSMVAKF
jgi:hypothetical protein